MVNVKKTVTFLQSAWFYILPAIDWNELQNQRNVDKVWTNWSVENQLFVVIFYPPQWRKYYLKIGGENLLLIYFALPVCSYKSIPALETIQLKWSRSTNKNILVSFSSYFFLGGWNSVVLLKHWISCKNREKPTEIPVVDQPQYGFEYFLSLYCPKTSKNTIGKYG